MSIRVSFLVISIFTLYFSACSPSDATNVNTPEKYFKAIGAKDVRIVEHLPSIDTPKPIDIAKEVFTNTKLAEPLKEIPQEFIVDSEKMTLRQKGEVDTLVLKPWELPLSKDFSVILDGNGKDSVEIKHKLPEFFRASVNGYKILVRKTEDGKIIDGFIASNKGIKRLNSKTKESTSLETVRETVLQEGEVVNLQDPNSLVKSKTIDVEPEELESSTSFTSQSTSSGSGSSSGSSSSVTGGPIQMRAVAVFLHVDTLAAAIFPTTEGLVSHLLGAFSIGSWVFERDAHVTLLLRRILISTTPLYVGNNDAVSLLSQFQNDWATNPVWQGYRNGQSVNITQFITSRPALVSGGTPVAGVATYGPICHTTGGLVDGTVSIASLQAPNSNNDYVAINGTVMAHEAGHNMGLTHVTVTSLMMTPNPSLLLDSTSQTRMGHMFYGGSTSIQPYPASCTETRNIQVDPMQFPFTVEFDHNIGIESSKWRYSNNSSVVVGQRAGTSSLLMTTSNMYHYPNLPEVWTNWFELPPRIANDPVWPLQVTFNAEKGFYSNPATLAFFSQGVADTSNLGWKAIFQQIMPPASLGLMHRYQNTIDPSSMMGSLMALKMQSKYTPQTGVSSPLLYVQALAMRNMQPRLRYSFGDTATNDGYGSALSALGDLNNDGIDDYLIGASLAGGVGKVELISGFDASIIRTFTGSLANGEFGAALAALPDMDADAYPDILVGAPGASNAYAISSANGTILQTFSGQATSRFGHAVGYVGRLSPSGPVVKEILIGAPEFVNAGSVRVGAVFLIDSLSGMVRATVEGDNADDKFGWSLGAKVYSDRTPFVVAGACIAPAIARPSYIKTIDYTTYSALNVYKTSDTINGTGFGCSVDMGLSRTQTRSIDIAVGSLNAATARIYNVNYTIGSSQPLTLSLANTFTGLPGFGSEVSLPGDLDGDGRGDLVVSNESSRSFLIFGTGPFVSGIYPFNSYAPTLNSNRRSKFGGRIALVGDINSDGFPDVGVSGTPLASSGNSGIGEVGIYTQGRGFNNLYKPIASGTQSENRWKQMQIGIEGFLLTGSNSRIRISKAFATNNSATNVNHKIFLNIGTQVVTGQWVQSTFNVKAGVIPEASLVISTSALTPYDIIEVPITLPQSFPSYYIQAMQFEPTYYGTEQLQVSNILELKPEN